MCLIASRAILVAVVIAAATAGCHPPGYGEDDAPAVDGAPATIDGASGAIDGGTPDAAPAADAAACTAGFSLAGHASATSVWLTGDFVAWAGTPAAGAIELVRGADLVWRVDHGFPPGSYQYKFIVDATTWIPDPGNASTVPDGFGGVNSVVDCP